MGKGSRDELNALSEELLDRKFSEEALEDLFHLKKAKLGKGVDKVGSEVFARDLKQNILILSRSVLSNAFRFSPYLEMLVLKGRSRLPRVIAKPTVRDKVCLIALKDVLHETLPDDVPRKLPNQVIRELVSALSQNSDVVVIKADIASFYDQIPHSRLFRLLKSRFGDGRVLQLLVKSVTGSVVPYGYRKSELLGARIERGVPQGLPISNFLANVYLRKFDEKSKLNFYFYERYVDDIVGIVPVSADSSKVLDGLKKSLAGVGLKLNMEKTKSFKYEERFDFLGYELQCGAARPRRSSVEKFIRSIAALFSSLKYRKLKSRADASEWSDERFANVFLKDLNERITGAISAKRQYGWVFYFNESTDISQFALVDSQIRRMARSTDLLTNEMRRGIKSVVRAYYESKNSKSSGYIWNYDSIDTADAMRKFLLDFGYFSESDLRFKSDGFVFAVYIEKVNSRLSSLEQDIGLTS